MMTIQDNNRYADALTDLKARFDIVLHDEENSPLEFDLQDGVMQPEFPGFAKTLSDLILEYLTAEQNDTHTRDVADKIDNAIPSEIIDLEQGYAASLIIWALVFEVVYHFTYDHVNQDKIVKLLLSCTQFPEGELSKSLSDDTFRWKSLRDLPQLDFRLYEIWQGQWPGITWDLDRTDTEDIEISTERSEQWALWLKLNAFVARLFALNIKQTNQHSTEAIWTLRDSALETDRHNPKQLQRDVTMCSVWIQYAGKQLFGARTEGNLNEEEARILRNGPLYTGRPGLCQERWEFWQKRLLEIAVSNIDIDPETRKLARQVSAQMKEIQAANLES